MNEWNAEVDKYAKEYKRQATEVSEWDKLLIENGSQISKLYAEVLQAESAQTTLDQGLDYIESQQNELASVLDVYEAQASQLLNTANASSLATAKSADEEREKAYGLAENLNRQLDDMSKNLSMMIDEVNKSGALTGLSNGASGDGEDTIGQIVKILNAHLESLQWIDGTSVQLRTRLGEIARKQDGVLMREREFMSLSRDSYGSPRV